MSILITCNKRSGATLDARHAESYSTTAAVAVRPPFPEFRSALRFNESRDQLPFEGKFLHLQKCPQHEETVHVNSVNSVQHLNMKYVPEKYAHNVKYSDHVCPAGPGCACAYEFWHRAFSYIKMGK